MLLHNSAVLAACLLLACMALPLVKQVTANPSSPGHSWLLSRSRSCRIVVHMRRGDVTTASAKREMPATYYINVVKNLVKVGSVTSAGAALVLRSNGATSCVVQAREHMAKYDTTRHDMACHGLLCLKFAGLSCLT